MKWFIVLLFWGNDGLYLQEPYGPRANDTYEECMEWVPWGTPLLEKYVKRREWVLECVQTGSAEEASQLLTERKTGGKE